MKQVAVKTYRLPRRRSYFQGLVDHARRARSSPQPVREVNGCEFDTLLSPDEEPTVRYLKWLPDAECETLNRMIEERGLKAIVGGLVQLIHERCHDNVFDLDNVFEHTEESERHSRNANALAKVLELIA